MTRKLLYETGKNTKISLSHLEAALPAVFPKVLGTEIRFIQDDFLSASFSSNSPPT